MELKPLIARSLFCEVLVLLSSPVCVSTWPRAETVVVMNVLFVLLNGNLEGLFLPCLAFACQLHTPGGVDTFHRAKNHTIPIVLSLTDLASHQFQSFFFSGKKSDCADPKEGPQREQRVE